MWETRGKSFRSFVQSIDLPGVPMDPEKEEESDLFYPLRVQQAPHHLLICDLLQAVFDGKIQRLMLFFPPGSAKSTYGTVTFPAFVMGNRPMEPVIVLSYAADLARKFGRRTRSIVKQRAYQLMYGTGLSPESSAADEWSLLNGAEYLANGLRGGVTGNRAAGLFIDDPVKGRAEADSPTFQASTYDAYINDARTRLKPGAWQVLIQTRWATGDLAGMLLPESYDGRSGWVLCRDGFEWFVCNVPMEAERPDDPIGRKPGEFLWPGYFRPEEYLPIKSSPRPTDQRTWASLYQQRPTVDGGLYYKREWLNYYPAGRWPQYLNVYGASDYAVTSKGGDWTVHIVVGVDAEGRIYVLDLWRDQATSDVWVERWCDLVLRWGPLWWAEDADQITRSVGPFLTLRARERNAFCARKQFQLGREDKSMRSRSMQGRAAMGMLYLPSGEGCPSWVEPFVAELVAFTGSDGNVDDQFDALGLIGRMLDLIAGGEAPPPPPAAEPDDYGGGSAADYSIEDDPMLA